MKSSLDAELLTIGRAAATFGLAAHVLRHWESTGLLEPVRGVADRRRYAPEDLRRIATILRAKQAGLGLDDIAEMLRADPTERRNVLLRHRERLIAEIEARREALHFVDCGINCEHEDFTTCPNYQRLVDELVGPIPSGPRRPVRGTAPDSRGAPATPRRAR